MSQRLIASREIRRLQRQVKELQQELEHRKHSPSLPSIPGSFPVVAQTHPRPLDIHGERLRPTEGAWSTHSNSYQRQLYGQSSTFFFVSRICSFIGTALQQPLVDHQINPNAACKIFASLDRADALPNVEYLPRAQENYFLGLFWQTYHCTVPILDEVDFRKHYETLWVTTSSEYSYRKPSPLVDIILALCMQYGMALVPSPNADQASRAHIDMHDSSIAGRSYYHRCQTLLMSEAETQSLTMLQCYIYSTIYLRNASFVNMAHNTLAIAIRVAHNLGLHQDPAKAIPLAQKELRLRLWWVVYVMECKACESLGRPWQTAQISQMTCSLPTDSQSAAQLSGSNFVSHGEDITWLSYHVQCAKLHIAIRAIYVAFDEKIAEVTQGKSEKYFFEDTETQEDLAEFLAHEMQEVGRWVHSVPKALKTPRKGNGEPFSTDRSPLEIDPSVPGWLQRQRLLLELLYHNLVMTLYRPFICFRISPTASTPLADGHSTSCLNHAISTTNIIHQVLLQNDILNGCHKAYQYQWTATLSLVGFSFGYPICSAAPSARKAMNTVRDVLDIFGSNFATAASAASVIRELTGKLDLFMDRFRTETAPSQQPRTTFYPNTRSIQPFKPHGGSIDSCIGSSAQDSGMQSTFTTTPGLYPDTLLELGPSFSTDIFGGSEAEWSEGNGFNTNMWPVF